MNKRSGWLCIAAACLAFPVCGTQFLSAQDFEDWAGQGTRDFSLSSESANWKELRLDPESAESASSTQAADPFQAREVIPALPESIQVVHPGYYRGAGKSFVELKDGGYGIMVSVRFRRGKHHHSKSVVFLLSAGTLRRQGDTLVLVKDGKAITVGKTRLHYYPPWQTTENAEIRVKVERVVDSGRAFGTYSVSAALALR